MPAGETLDHAAISRICQRHGVARLRLFGSALKDTFDPERSDIDFLVNFQPDAVRTFRALIELRAELEQVVGRPVDLVDADAVRNPYFAQSAFQSAEDVYAA